MAQLAPSRLERDYQRRKVSDQIVVVSLHDGVNVGKVNIPGGSCSHPRALAL